MCPVPCVCVSNHDGVIDFEEFVKIMMCYIGISISAFLAMLNGLFMIYDYWYENDNTNYPEKELWRNLGIIYEDLHPLIIFVCNRCAPFILLVEAQIILPFALLLLIFCGDIWFCYKESPILNY